MLTLRKVEAEDRPLRCYARRGRFASVRCEQPALHYLSGYPLHQVHAGRDRAGKWHFWPVAPDHNFICQVRNTNTGWLQCPHRESGGYQCEAQGPHERHIFGMHTIRHAHLGNGFTCEAIEGWLSEERNKYGLDQASGA